jgi:hypothetical protein
VRTTVHMQHLPSHITGLREKPGRATPQGRADRVNGDPYPEFP